MIKHLITPEHKRIGVLLADFPGLQFSQHISDIPGWGMFSKHGIAYHLFIDPSGLDRHLDTSIAQQSGPDV